jgi:hypothetical protein
MRRVLIQTAHAVPGKRSNTGADVIDAARRGQFTALADC